MLDDILLGAHIAFEGYRLPRIHPDILAGMRVAFSEYPFVRLYKRLRMNQTVKEAAGRQLEERKKHLSVELSEKVASWTPVQIVVPRNRYYVRMLDGARIAFDSLDSAIQYANSNRVRGKCWVEDGDQTTREGVLLVGSHDGKKWVYHALPQGVDDVDMGVVAPCGLPGRTMRIGRDDWFSGQHYCGECFPEKSGLREYINRHSMDHLQP